MTSKTILVVDDEPDIRRVVSDILEDEGFQVETAGDASSARTKFYDIRPDLVLLDIWMPDTDGVSLLTEWADQNGRIPPVVMISGHGTVETAVEAIRLGAYDFLEKPLSTAKLLVTVERALENSQLYTENTRLRNQLEPASELIGHSPAIQEIRGQISRIGSSDSWVLVRGEPGSGKGVVVRALHQVSHHRDQPFVEVNLAAIPAESIAIELFGLENEDGIQAGRFEQANGGTLVLDEVGDLDLTIQGKLLGALEEGRFYRVGGRTLLNFDVRIIATSNQELEAKIRHGSFREDLFYRLSAVPLAVPSLRQHREDIPDLISYYSSRVIEAENLDYRRFSTAAINYLRNRPWPGNVRELRNFVQRVLITTSSEEIDAEETREAMVTTAILAEHDVSPGVKQDFDQPIREAREEFERAYFSYHLLQAGGNMTELAQRCGMERTHLYRKLKGLGIDPKSVKNRP